MTVIAVNTRQRQIEGREALADALHALPEGAPVTVMTHGFRSDPFRPGHSPHTHILSPVSRNDCWKAVSWPRHLGLTRPGAGLAVGFGWPARGRLDRVARRAWEAGAALSETIAGIGEMRPDARVRIIAHSLGARVALRALQDQRPGLVEAVILLSAAETQAAADRAAFSPAGRAARILNVTSGENLAFELLFRLFAPGTETFVRHVSAGLSGPHRGWLDLKIDDADHLAALHALGYRAKPPHRRVCHWSSYLRPGLFPVYRDVFASGTAFARLRAALPDAPAPVRPRLPALARRADCA
ncbi:alpha/beta hydrolase [Rhodobacterales bacterium HKCCE3408]|nr:alpha/beta hydrolase [Rhodobacterales bacterium HKCCE3408]